MKLWTLPLVVAMCILSSNLPIHADNVAPANEPECRETVFQKHPVIKRALLLPVRLVGVPFGFTIGGTVGFTTSEIRAFKQTHSLVQTLRNLPANAAWCYVVYANEGWQKPFSLESLGLREDPNLLI